MSRLLALLVLTVACGGLVVPIESEPASDASSDQFVGLDAALGPFDRGAAASVLGEIATSLGGCRVDGGPVGQGHVKVTFERSGSVSQVDVDTPPFQGTTTGDCIAAQFWNARVPAFAGTSVTVGKSFLLQ